MSETYLPQTEIDLESWMKENCYNFNSYSINGNSVGEGFGIEKLGSVFAWYYTERGERNNLKYFRTEKEVVVYAFDHIKADKWARTHCIGFTTSHHEKRELEDLLRTSNVDFFQDEIPYYGPEHPVYRTFVSGCDIRRVAHLKDKYFKQI